MLIKPQARFEASYRAYLDELGDEARYPFTLDLDCTDFAAFLQRLDDFEHGRRLPEGYVSSTTFWLIDSNEVVGASNLRHELSDGLRAFGGHIGLGVRPSARGRGLGACLLKRTVERARARGIGDVHVHCYRSNLASARMIRSVGGRLDSEDDRQVTDEVLLRFIIPTPQGFG